MMIDKRERFQKLVEKIEYRTLADIAADHCYISLLALEEDKVDYVIASDLNKAPLETGKANIKEYGFEGKIETRLGSGLETIKAGEVESIIIAGIGGGLMRNLLKNDEGKLSTFKQLILQPQNNEIEVRRYVHSIGYSIKDECYIFEKGMRYIILNCFKGEEEIPYSEKDYVLGKAIDKNTKDIHKEFIKNNYKNTLKLKERLDVVENKENMDKFKKAIEHIEIYENYFGKEVNFAN